jgi:hypothetical protein
MAQVLYSAATGAAVALVAATAKSVLSVTAPASFGVDLRKIRLAFDGVTASDKGVLVEVCYSTFATAGTTTAGTVNQIAGRTVTAGFTTAYNYTIEPTVLTVVESFLVSPYNGTYVYDYPLGDSPDSAVSNGFVIRCTAPTSAVNVRGTLIFGRC